MQWWVCKNSICYTRGFQASQPVGIPNTVHLMSSTWHRLTNWKLLCTRGRQARQVHLLGVGSVLLLALHCTLAISLHGRSVQGSHWMLQCGDSASKGYWCKSRLFCKSAAPRSNSNPHLSFSALTSYCAESLSDSKARRVVSNCKHNQQLASDCPNTFLQAGCVPTAVYRLSNTGKKRRRACGFKQSLERSDILTAASLCSVGFFHQTQLLNSASPFPRLQSLL